jgi:hypothetical protein
MELLPLPVSCFCNSCDKGDYCPWILGVNCSQMINESFPNVQGEKLLKLELWGVVVPIFSVHFKQVRNYLFYKIILDISVSAKKKDISVYLLSNEPMFFQVI